MTFIPLLIIIICISVITWQRDKANIRRDMERIFHTPEGVRDIYGKEYARKQELKERFRRIFGCFGYQGIQTPSFEFFDIFPE